ncbi:NAD-dependent epimerase/dehydratase family protein [Nonomuraea ferruginea]
MYASSVGAYSPRPKDVPVDESWPTHGFPGAAYGREKAYVERVLDVFENDNPGIRVVRMRPGFIFKREAASEQRRLFAGPFLPRRMVKTGRIPFVPDIPGLKLQVLHAEDAAEAYRLAVTKPVSGAFNIAAEPVLDPRTLAELLGARVVPVSGPLARAAVSARLAPAAGARRAGPDGAGARDPADERRQGPRGARLDAPAHLGGRDPYRAGGRPRRRRRGHRPARARQHARPPA